MGLLYVKTADGRKKPSLWVWLFLLAVLLGGSIFLVTNTKETGLQEMTGTTKARLEERAPIPIERDESDKSAGSSSMDAETINAMKAQIALEKEQGGGYLDSGREQQIINKYEREYENKQASNFRPTVDERLRRMQEADEPEEPAPTPTPPQTETVERYRTLGERLASENISPSQRSNSVREFGSPPERTPPEDIPKSPQGNISSTDWTEASNLLPLGTFVPCVLDGDIVTSDLTSHVWANVVLDVTFRRQLQLPKGLVRLRGQTATQPVQDVVDVIFDTMVFSDGTELPMSGFAYGAFDPRYPHRFRTRGIPGELIIPPLFIRLQGLLYTAALGASEAYVQNYVNENTQTQTTYTPVPIVNPTTGETTYQIVQNQGQPVNNQIGGTIGLGAAQGALEELVGRAQDDLDKYRPYLIVEKGTPFYVQLDTTLDLSKRRVNGTAIAREERLKRDLELQKQGVPMPMQEPAVFPPGDARSKYSGAQRTAESASLSPAQEQAIQSLTNPLPLPGNLSQGTQMAQEIDQSTRQ